MAAPSRPPLGCGACWDAPDAPARVEAGACTGAAVATGGEAETCGDAGSCPPGPPRPVAGTGRAEIGKPPVNGSEYAESEPDLATGGGAGDEYRGRCPGSASTARAVAGPDVSSNRVLSARMFLGRMLSGRMLSGRWSKPFSPWPLGAPTRVVGSGPVGETDGR